MVAVAVTVAANLWGTVVDGVKQYPLHEGQRDVLASKSRFVAACAGTGGGKTAVGPLWLTLRIQDILKMVRAGKRDLRRDPIMCMVVAPTYPILARATVPTLVRTFAGTDLEGVYIPSRNIYHLPNGMGTVWTLSADNAPGLEGGQFDCAWLDEGGQMSMSAWVAVQGRLGQRQGKCLITTTPYTLNWLYHDFYKRALRGDRTYYIRQWASDTNPAYPKEEVERARGSMSPQRFAMRYQGKLVQMEGLVYPDFASCMVDDLLPPSGRNVGGIDFGFNNPLCALAGVQYVDAEGKDMLHVWYERYKRLQTTAVHSNALPYKPPSMEVQEGMDTDEVEPICWWADPSRPESIQELKMGGHWVRGAKNDVLVGIDAVNERIYTGRLKISVACKALVAEAEQYHYPEKDERIVGEQPVKEMDHAMDALRYMVMGVDVRRLDRQQRHTNELVNTHA